MEVLREISTGILQGDSEKVESMVKKALEIGLACEEILDKGLFEGMDVVGKLFKEEEIFLPEVLMAAKAMGAGQKLLEPLLVGFSGGKKKAKIILGTVKGDVHDLGKNLLGMMFKGAGFDVFDLGVDISEEEFAESVKKQKPDMLGMSALLTMTMPRLKSTIEFLENKGLRKQVKVIIGGACVTQKYADEVGADGYAENAAAAVVMAKQLLKL